MMNGQLQFDRDASFFDALYRDMDNGGLSAMLHDLLQRDIAGWKPSPPPENEALLDQRFKSLTPDEQWWFYALTTGQLPNAGAPAPTICFSEDLCQHIQQTVPVLRDRSTRQLIELVKKYASEPFTDGSKRGWRFPALQNARIDWSASHGEVEWDDQIEEWTTSLYYKDVVRNSNTGWIP
jgi:hypothetical protein